MKRQLAMMAGMCVLSSSAVAVAWDAESRDSVGGKAEWRGNTHLFIVEKAIDLLAHSDDPFALGAARFLDSCTTEWRQGLWDADGRDELVDSGNKGSHFYDPNPDDHCHTYALGFDSCVSGSFDARRNAQHQIQQFSTGKSAVPAKTYGHHNKSRCYALGLALHYMTDVTMPYHAARFSGGSFPLMLHPSLETYAPVIQHRFVESRWTPRASGSPDVVLVDAASDAKAVFHRLNKAVAEAGGICVYPSTSPIPYAGTCFRNKPAVDAAIGEALRRAQRNTASYLQAVFRAHPEMIPLGAPQFAAIWVKQSGPDWVARHGMTSEQYQQEFDKQVQQGFCLVDISGYEQAGRPRFAAIWEKKTCPAWTARHGMTADQYQQAFDSFGKQGFRLTLVNGYSVAGQDRYAAIWQKSPGPAMVARHGMTSQQYQQAFDSLGKQGFCLSQVSGYSVANQDRYAAIWENKPCPAFTARHGMTSQQYQQAFDQATQQGFRLRSVSGYQINGEPSYAAIWDKSSGPALVARHGLTADQYQKAFDQLVKDGFRLVWVDGD